jgi:type II secretory pathway pseudopilin PulG
MRNNRAKSFVTIMIIIAFLALLLRFAIDRIIKFNIVQNESNAQSTLKLLSVALENYAKDNQGLYPTNLSVLTKSKPAYLDKDYILQSPSKGYNFGCLRLEPSGYSCSANPVRCKLNGTMVYTVTTGGLFVSEECEK